MSQTAVSRVRFPAIADAAELLTPAFLEYFVPIHDDLSPRISALLDQRAEALRMAHEHGQLPLNRGGGRAQHADWQVPPVPPLLQKPGIEISGPCSVTPMFINALNPGPEGERAVGDLDDDEDSSGQRLVDTLQATKNRLAAVRRELRYFDSEKKKEYRLADGPLPFLIHRERGLHLYEPEVTLDGNPVNAAILGTALNLFHVGKEQARRGQGIFFYIPKLEFPAEARLYRDLFDQSLAALAWPTDVLIRAIVLVESLPCIFHMEEMLYELGAYAAGLNAARWDLKASILEYGMADPLQVWPDRFGVDIKTTPFLGDIFRRLVAVCRRRGGVAIGGMATALPSADPEVNRAAAEAIRKDKEWEAEQGFLRAWVAHIFHMKTAAEPFVRAGGKNIEHEAASLDRHPLRIEVPEGPITLAGTRRNCRMLIEYLEGWLNGRGAKAIDSLAGQPGARPALMEDLATGRISVAQLAQRIRHHVTTTAGPAAIHDPALVKELLQAELSDILNRGKFDQASMNRYQAAFKIALRWIKNYTELNFRSLASYSRAELMRIASEVEAF